MLFSNVELKKSFLKFLEKEVSKQNQKPILNIVQIGDNFASTKYVNLKKKVGESVGIQVDIHRLPEETNPKEIEKILEKVETNKEGLIIQLPVPEKFNYLVPKTPLVSDVDLLSQDHYKLWKKGILPPTIGAIDLVIKQILEGEDFVFNMETIERKINLRGKVCAVIGQGILVGEPMVKYFMDRKATVINLNSSTPNPQELTQKADIIVCAAGRPKFIKEDWFKKDAIVIDASTSESDGQIAGDVDTENVKEKVVLCPSPKGIGPLTVRYIFTNLLRLRNLK